MLSVTVKHLMRTMPSSLLFLVLASTALSSQISLSSQSAGPGTSVVISAVFSPQGDLISALQFDLQYDPSAMSLGVTAGDALRNSGKSLYYTDLAPDRRRFIVVGLNQNAISTGALINLFVNLSASVSNGTHTLVLSSVFSADVSGYPVLTTSTDGAVRVQGTTGSRLQPDGVLNGGSLLSGAVAPGEVITLIGSGIGPVPASDASPIPPTSVLFDSMPAPLLYVAQNQINAIVPYGIAGQTFTQLLVTGGGQVISGFSLPVAPAAPAIFTIDGSGTGEGAILNEDFTVNSPSNPARPGSIVVMYATGAGQTDPPGVDGQTNGDYPPRPILPISVKIGGLDSEVVYAGGAPQLISGILQINCRIPERVVPGFAVPVELSVGTVVGPTGVTLAVR
jgi:uncharacterized protein (TIGR03437 family)